MEKAVRQSIVRGSEPTDPTPSHLICMNRTLDVCKNCEKPVAEHLMVQDRPRYCRLPHVVSVYQPMDTLELVEYYENSETAK